MASIRVASCSLAMGPGHQIGQLGGIVVLERHGVDLDVDAGRLGRRNPGQHPGQVPAPGQFAEQVGLEGVHGDVDPTDARRRQLGGEFLKPCAIGGQGQLVQGAGLEVPGQGVDQAHDALAHQRLAAGDPQLAHPQIHKARGDPVQLLEGQDLGLGQEGHVLGHAVDAAQVTAVGDGDPQIGHGAAKPVHQGGARLGMCGVKRRHSWNNIEALRD